MKGSNYRVTGFAISLVYLLISFAVYSGSAVAQTAARTEQDPAAGTTSLPAGLEDSILIGLDAAMKGSAGQAGVAIRRGIVLAMDEINRAGGVLGRWFELFEKDNHGVPARGIDNIAEFAAIENLVAVVGGLHTPVALAELKTIHERKIIYLGPWAAGTPIVDNGYTPNYVFRISARDEFAGGYLIEKAQERGLTTPGLLLWRTGWGRSNHKAMTAAMQKNNITGGVEWFNTGQRSIAPEIDRLIEAGADVIILVANAPEGLTVIRDMAARPPEKRVPIISHWGITGGNIFIQDPPAFDAVDLTFLQTFSFYEPYADAKAKAVVAEYCLHFRVCGSIADIISPVGTAHAYDLVHLLKRAIEAAGTIDRAKVRTALEGLGRYEGLVRVYDPPFTPARHDALNASDFRLSRYDSTGAIVPVSAPAIR